MRRRVLFLLLVGAAVATAGGHADSLAASCPFHDHDEPHDHHAHGHSCDGGGDSHHGHHHHHGHGHDRPEIQWRLPEELAEEADLELDAFHRRHHRHHHDHHHGHDDFQPASSPMGVWLSAMGCSLLVSMASLVCLVLLPVIFFQGKPSKAMVDSLAVFGLRKWNERWVILDPTSGNMEYKIRRNETAIKGIILFDASSTITLSPVNFQGMPKYDGCCFYIGTPQKKDYFLCAETPGAAKAWVSTLQHLHGVRVHRSITFSTKLSRDQVTKEQALFSVEERFRRRKKRRKKDAVSLLFYSDRRKDSINCY